MKRLWAAAVIAAVAVVLCSMELIFTTNSANSIKDKIISAQHKYENGEKKTALLLISNAKSELDSKKELLDIFLYHDTIDLVSMDIAAAKKYIESGNDEFLAECEKIKEQLKSIVDSELPKFENIL